MYVPFKMVMIPGRTVSDSVSQRRGKVKQRCAKGEWKIQNGKWKMHVPFRTVMILVRTVSDSVSQWRGKVKQRCAKGGNFALYIFNFTFFKAPGELTTPYFSLCSKDVRYMDFFALVPLIEHVPCGDNLYRQNYRDPVRYTIRPLF